MRCPASALFLLAAALAAPPPDPRPAPGAVVLAPSARARFTVLSPSLLRLQYASDGVFSDAPTLAIVNRALPVPAFTSSFNATTGVLTLTTGALTLTFNDSAAAPSAACAAPAPGTDAGPPRVRSVAFPAGAPAADAAACCAACARAPDCAAYVFDDAQRVCFPLASFNGTVPARNRTFAAHAAGGGFSRASLRIAAAALPGGAPLAWAPGDEQAANLLGTVTQMDCYTTPAECFATYTAELAASRGLLARDGWTVFDDSATTLRGPPRADGSRWWAPPRAGDVDLYFSAYGDDFRGALAGFASVMGAPELPPRAALGIFWSQNYPWTNITGNTSIVTGVLDQYAALDIPLSTLVLDMDWHVRHQSDAECATWGSWDFNTTAFPDPAGFLQWLNSSANPLGHPLATSLNVHPQTGAYHCLERYAAFAAAANASSAHNETIPCDMASEAWINALWSVYYDAQPLSSTSFFWTDYGGCGGSEAGAPPQLLWSNTVYAEQRARSGALRPLTFSRYGGWGNPNIGFSGDTFQHELTLDFEIRMTPTAANALFGYWSHDMCVQRPQR